MENEYPMQFDWSGVRPQERERNPLSGQTVSVRIHGGGSLSFRGKEYKPDPATSLIADLPIEAVAAIECATFWTNGKPFTPRLDVIGRDSELTGHSAELSS